MGITRGSPLFIAGSDLVRQFRRSRFQTGTVSYRNNVFNAEEVGLSDNSESRRTMNRIVQNSGQSCIEKRGNHLEWGKIDASLKVEDYSKNAESGRRVHLRGGAARCNDSATVIALYFLF